MIDQRITVRLDQDTKRRLEEEVTSSGSTESEVVRAALSIYLAKKAPASSCLELAKRHGLIGVSKKLPADLSTNPAHFEGFGK
jgi:Arc/MetJ-type ribon-helix-helix transcriptional regulator